MNLSLSVFFLAVLCKANYEDHLSIPNAMDDIVSAFEKTSALEKIACDAKNLWGSNPQSYPYDKGIRQLKRSKKNNKKKNKKSKAGGGKLAVLKEELKQCQKALEPKPEFLFIQTSKDCSLERVSKKKGFKYKLVSPNVAGDTFAFSDRPFRIETVLSTTAFVEAFDATFGEDPPNTAVTFLTPDKEQFKGPLVAIFVDSMSGNVNSDGSVAVTYEIEQSPSQNGTLSLELFFDEGETSVDFKDCSLFIDGGGVACTICRGVVGPLIGIGGEVACSATCIGLVEVAGIPFGSFLNPAVDVVAAACPLICVAVAGGLGGLAACSSVGLC